jgi:hypothetical protein
MDLTPDQRAEAERLYTALRAATDADLRALHRIGAKAVELTLAGRKKRATSGRAPAARAAVAPPSSSATPPAGS